MSLCLSYCASHAMGLGLPQTLLPHPQSSSLRPKPGTVRDIVPKVARGSSTLPCLPCPLSVFLPPLFVFLSGSASVSVSVSVSCLCLCLCLCLCVCVSVSVRGASVCVYTRCPRRKAHVRARTDSYNAIARTDYTTLTLPCGVSLIQR